MQHLEAKRGALTASLEQLVGQINRVNGAIAVVDELIAEQRARDEAEGPLPEFGGIYREQQPWWNNFPSAKKAETPSVGCGTPGCRDPKCEYGTEEPPPAAPAPKEMLPVLPADEPAL